MTIDCEAMLARTKKNKICMIAFVIGKVRNAGLFRGTFKHFLQKFFMHHPFHGFCRGARALPLELFVMMLKKVYFFLNNMDPRLFLLLGALAQSCMLLASS